jgi:hypothetical protein
MPTLYGSPACASPAPTASGLQQAASRRPRFVTAALLGSAALIHAVLTPEHFGEGWHFGVAFLVMTVLQATLAIGLLAQPGPTVEEWARRSTVFLVALYLLARIVPVPGELRPENATLIGGFAVAIEVAALVALACLPRHRRPRLAPVAVGVLAALGTTIAVLLTTGSLRYLPGLDLSAEYSGSAPVLVWRNLGEGFTVNNPFLTLYLTNHLVVFGSLFTLLLTALLAFEVGIGAARSRVAVLAGRRESRHWFWMPALLTAPVCCGAPLFGIVGASAFAILLRHGWIPLAVAVLLGSISLSLGARRGPAPPASEGTPKASKAPNRQSGGEQLRAALRAGPGLVDSTAPNRQSGGEQRP